MGASKHDAKNTRANELFFFNFIFMKQTIENNLNRLFVPDEHHRDYRKPENDFYVEQFFSFG